MRLRLIPLALLLAHPTVSAQVPTFDDVVVGQVPLDAGGTIPLLTDVYLPSGATAPTPIVVWIHGGGWATGTHNGMPSAIYKMLDSGVALASAGYRLTSEAIFPAQIHDVKGVIRHLRAHAATYNIDPARIAVWGASAGGHLATLLATSGGVPGLEGTSGGNLTQSSRVVAAVNYFGPTDLLEMNLDLTWPPGSVLDHDAPDSYESRLIGFTGPNEGVGVLRANRSSAQTPFPEKLSLITLANPITHISADDAPLFIAHGLIDTIVPFAQSQRLYDACLALGQDPVLKLEPASGHGSLANSTYAESRAFLLSHLSSAGAVGVPFCFGDGTGATCPCNNTGPETTYEGCRNSLGSGGRLRARGVASVSADTLTLQATQLSGTTALFIQGSATAGDGDGVPFGHGMVCVSGTILRICARPTAAGTASYPNWGETPISLQGLNTAGVTRYYQTAYRDTVVFCSLPMQNLTNGHAITFVP